MADMSDDLAAAGVACVSLYPGLVRTERMLATKAGPRIARSQASETPEYTGRAVVALLLMHRGIGPSPQGAAVMSKGWAGRTVFGTEVGAAAGFSDVDGHTPRDRVMASVRREMGGPPWHWVPPGGADPVAEHRGGRGLSKVK